MRRITMGFHGILRIGYWMLLATAIARGSDYDPLAISSEFTPRVVDLTVRDGERQREIPVRIYLPQAMRAAQVVLFSHGC